MYNQNQQGIQDPYGNQFQYGQPPMNNQMNYDINNQMQYDLNNQMNPMAINQMNPMAINQMNPMVNNQMMFNQQMPNDAFYQGQMIQPIVPANSAMFVGFLL